MEEERLEQIIKSFVSTKMEYEDYDILMEDGKLKQGLFG